MPLEFCYDSTKKIIRGKITSPFVAAELRDALQGMVNAGNFPPDVPVLWDVRGVDFREIDSELMRQLNSIRKQYPQRGNARIALIAPTDLAYGMSRMYELLSADMPQTIMVFRTVEEGERWLLSEYEE